jgi:hypothetical protein
MGYWLHGDMAKTKFVMENPIYPKKEFEFTFSNPDSRCLTLDGSDGRDQIRVNSARWTKKQFVLLGRGIHWIDEDVGLVVWNAFAIVSSGRVARSPRAENSGVDFGMSEDLVGASRVLDFSGNG